MPTNQQCKVAVELPVSKPITLSFSPCRCPQRYVPCIGAQRADLGLNGLWEEMVQRILLCCRTLLTVQSPKLEVICSGRGFEPMSRFQGVLHWDESSLYCRNPSKLLLHGSSPSPAPHLLPQSTAAFLRFAQSSCLTHN